MKYRYKARDAGGAFREGTLEAADRGGALMLLQQNGLVVSELKEERRGGFSLNQEITLGQRGISLGQLAMFCGQFAALTGVGVPVLQALSVLTRQFKGKRLERVLQAVVRSVEGGNSLSQAMKEHAQEFPPVMLYITAVAEVTGRLDESYALLARQFEQEEHFAQKVKSALTYPVVVLVIALAVMIFMITYVLPTYAGMYQQMGAELPAVTRVMLGFGQALSSYWYLFLAGSGLFWLTVRQAMKDAAVRGWWQGLVMKVPVWGGLAYKREMTNLCRTLATMSRSGVPIMAALATLQEAMGFVPFRQALAGVQEQVRAGESLGEALQRQAVFDHLSVQIIALGEAAGNLDAMLARVAEMNEKDVNRLLERLTATLEPLLTVLLGGMVLAIIIPMLLPMFDILGQIQ